MNEKANDSDLTARRSVLTGVGVAVAGLAASGCAQSSSGFQPARHDLDAWFDGLPGNHRVFIDSAMPRGGAEGLLYANNLYTARETAYAGEPADFAMVLCFRHLSTPFAYNDAIWEKYGDTFYALMQFPDPATGGAPRSNLMNSTAYPPGSLTMPNLGVTIDLVTDKGLQLAVCAAATQFFAMQIAAATGGSAEAINDELVAGALIPSSRFVSAGVMAATRAQEYGYSLLYAG
jgi:hypothetical protein